MIDSKKKGSGSILKTTLSERTYMLMLLPGLIFLLIFSYAPMVGIMMAFQKYNPVAGMLNSRWIGMQNFQYIIKVPEVGSIFANTLIIACSNIVLGLIIPIIYSLLLNEVRSGVFKKAVQTIVYLPFFLSWVVLGVIFRQLFSMTGLINNILSILFEEPIMFLSSNTLFRPLLIITNQWKGFGWGTIIYLAAITSIDPGLYESAMLDGATRFQRVLYITLPGISATIILMMTLSLGNVLNAGFDQVFNLYNPLVYETADIIDTYVYRLGLVKLQYSMSTAVGLLKSVISFFLITLSYKLANKYANYQIF